jgi:tRNA-dihydrouridine synthase A
MDAPSRREAMDALLSYAEMHLANGGRLNNIARHILGLYQGLPGARLFRRHLSENAVKDGAGISVLREAMTLVEDRQPGASRSALAAE